MKVFVVTAMLFSVCAAASIGGSENTGSAEVKEEHVASYSFDWVVKDDEAKLDFGHQETSDGDLTTGSYRVLLPNLVIQTVNYSADEHSGYVAEVTNEEVNVDVKEEEGEKVAEEEEVQQQVRE